MINKKTPQIRFKEFSKEWDLRNLSEIALYRNGKAHEQDISETGNFIVVNSKFVSTNGRIRKFSNKQIEPLEKNEIAFVLSDVPNGKALARTFLVPESNKFSLNQRIAGIKSYHFTDSYFLSELMNRNRYFLKFDDGIGQTNLSKEAVENFGAFYPEIEEQIKIGSFLKGLDETITMEQQELAALKQTKQGFLQKMFPKTGAFIPEFRFPDFEGEWRQLTLKEYVGGVSDGDWIQKEHIHDSGDYRIIQTGNLGIGVYIDKIKHSKYLNEDSFQELKANEIFKGDILISRLAEPAGRTIILPEISSKAVTAVDVAVIRPSEYFNSYFLMTEMNSPDLLNAISKHVSGTSHKRLSRKNLEKIILNIPSIEEQKKIGEFFKNLDEAIVLQEKELDALKQTKKAFLQKMFV